jgi:hypothetical protein
MRVIPRIVLAACILVALAACTSKPASTSSAPSTDRVAVSPTAPFARLTYASGWETEKRSGFVEFNHWAQRYLNTAAGSRPALVAEGVALAKTRRELLAQLIRTAPQDALAATVPADVRARLPAEVLAQLEIRVAGRGNFLPVVMELPPGSKPAPKHIRVELGGHTYQAFVGIRRQGETGKYDVPLHGIAVDSLLALHDSPLRVPEPGESPPEVKLAGSNKSVHVRPIDHDGESATSLGQKVVLAEYAGEMFAFPGAPSLGHFEQALLRAENLRGPHTPRIVIPAGGFPEGGGIFADLSDPGWTTGHKKVLVIRVDYSDRPGEPHPLADVNGLLTTYVKPFYHDMSYGQTTLAMTVTPQVYRMPHTADFYRTGIPAPVGDEPAWVLHEDARTAAAADYLIADYDRIAVLSTPIFFFFGVAQIGTERFYVSPISGAFSSKLFTHELGHTYGLDHANLWQVTDGNPESRVGSTALYGDPFDDMADDAAGDLLPHYHFHPWAKSALGWLPESAITTVHSSGLYPLYHFDDAGADLTRPLALRVFRDGIRNYWISYRHNSAGHPALDHGAYVLWGYHIHRQRSSHLLDLNTPGVSALDAPMAPSGWLTDPFHNVDLGLFAFSGVGADEKLLMKIAVSASPGFVAFWGWGPLGTGLPAPPDITGGVIGIAAGPGHALAVKADTTVVAWGSPNTYGEATVPPGLHNVTAVAAGTYHSLALDRSGTVSGWGNNSDGQLDVPAGLTNVVAIAAGANRSVALRSDGTVVQWGATASDAYPMPAGLGSVTAIAAGGYHVLALRSDGTVVAWGNNIHSPGDTSGPLDVPPGLTGVVAIAAGSAHSLVLKSDGTVIAWGNNTYGQTDVPAGLTNVVTLGAGLYHSLARQADGTLVAWGENSTFACDVPAGAPSMVKLTGGLGYSLALTGP